MRSLSLDWCFEGGCTYEVDAGESLEAAPAMKDLDTTELEAMYREPCIGRAD